MKFTALMIPVIALACGCGGAYVESDGTYTTGAYVEEPAPPVEIETYPRYYYRGDYVYDVNGRYYRHHGRHWYRYHQRPADLDIRVEPGDHHVEHHEHEHEHEHERD